MKQIQPENHAENADKPKRTQAEQLIDLAFEAELFHSPEKEAFASVRVGDHTENYKVHSESFRNWIRHKYYQKTSRGIGAQALQDALSMIEAKAVFEGQTREVFLRLARVGDRIFVDLGSPDWSYVEISAAGWTHKNDIPPVRFYRSKTMRPLPIPDSSSSGEKIELLRSFLNVGDDASDANDAFKLIVSWVVATYNGNGPFPALVFYGEQGSSKSTSNRVIRDLTDPSTTPVRTLPRKAEDLLISAKYNRVLGFDNVSFLPDEVSDDLCRLSTGGGIAKRSLYSDDGETVLNAMRPIILNGIEEFVARGDLASRSIFVTLPAIPSSKRKREEVFWAEFDRAKPAIFSAILHAVSESLAMKDTFVLEESPRMADAWHFISAAETAFGWNRFDCLKAYGRHQNQVAEMVLSASQVYPFVRDLVEKQEWSGTAEQLLAAINSKAEFDRSIDRRHWPQTPKSLSDRLRRISPALKQVSLEVEMIRKSHGRIISIRKSTRSCVTGVIPSRKLGAHDANDDDDGQTHVESWDAQQQAFS